MAEAPSARLAPKAPRSERIEIATLPPTMQNLLRGLDVNADGQLNALEIARGVEQLKAERLRSRAA